MTGAFRATIALALSSIILAGPRSSTRLSRPPVDQVPTREGYFSSFDGARLFYRVAGDGANAVVFLHGGPGLGIDDGGYDLEPLAARGYKFAMLNERGGGRSQVITDTARLGIDSYVRDLESFANHLHLRKFSIVAISWGTAVGARFAAAHPERINRLVWLSPMPANIQYSKARDQHESSLLTAAQRERAAKIEAVWAKTDTAQAYQLCREYFALYDSFYVADVRHLTRMRGDYCDYPPEAIRNMLHVMNVSYDSLGNFDLTPLLHSIAAPSLTIEGEKTQIPLDATEAWAQASPDSRLLLVRDAGHMNWVDQPELVIAAIDEFLRGNWPAQSKRLTTPPR